ENLNINNQSQSNTIQQLTSGYRINKSGDDAAGLAVANGYRSSVAELTQGVANANDGISQLQIIDGGLSNISTILDRLKTLATQSASGTFTGSRATLNQEYQQELGEITRQANNINLNAGGTFNNALSVYIGGANNASNATVSVDLSGAENAVDATSLGIANTNVLGATTGFGATNTQTLTGGATLTAAETFKVNAVVSGVAQSDTITVAAGTYTAQGLLDNINASLTATGDGVQASLDSGGHLVFSGSGDFNVKDTTTTPALIAGSTVAASNAANYQAEGAASFTSAAETLAVTTNGQTYYASLGTGLTAAQAVASINNSLAGSGVNALLNTAGTGIEFQSTSSFGISTGGTAAGVFAAGTANAAQTVTTPSSTGLTGNATNAIAAINAAIQALGLVQGSVGAGENKLQYATNLAQSQISSFSSAESQIRDADVAADASDLTKDQVLTQTSVAALAQANSEGQAVLKLLQG
ncbi:MAG TPA: flagellin, partial [Bryobacteraceae bacterium]